MIVTALIILIPLLGGCNNQRTSTTSVDKNQIVSVDKNQIASVDYSTYKGKWICSENSKTSAMVLTNGGQIIDIQEINGGHIKGTIESIQKPPANRIASTEFEGTIINDNLDFSFDNDGLNNKGKCSITFEKDKVNVKVSTTVSDDNASGWSLGNGNFIFLKDTIATSENLEKDTNILEVEALKIINRLIEQKKIVLTEPDSNCQVQNFGSNTKGNITYYVIRIAYIDPNNKQNTETLARYWVSVTTGDVYQEDLATGKLTTISQ